MRIALIAHDEKKPDLDVERMASGPLGSDLMIGAEVDSGDCEAVIFPRDPLTAQLHEPDISTLLRICDVHDAPLVSAEVVITSLGR